MVGTHKYNCVCKKCTYILWLYLQVGVPFLGDPHDGSFSVVSLNQPHKAYSHKKETPVRNLAISSYPYSRYPAIFLFGLSKRVFFLVTYERLFSCWRSKGGSLTKTKWIRPLLPGQWSFDAGGSLAPGELCCASDHEAPCIPNGRDIRKPEVVALHGFTGYPQIHP